MSTSFSLPSLNVNYLGKYVPWLASTILKNNAIPKYRKINLKAIAIGNGWYGFYAYLFS